MSKITATTRAHIQRVAPAAVVFAVAAYQSYWHTVEVATANGEAHTAYLMALGTDGLMVVAGRFLMSKTPATRLARWTSGTAFVLGVVATFAVNILAATPTPAGMFMAVWPAVAMTATTLVMHVGDQRPKPATRARKTVAKGTKTALRSVV